MFSLKPISLTLIYQVKTKGNAGGVTQTIAWRTVM